MYTNNSEVSDNVSIGNTVGLAIMFSHHLRIHGNVSDGDRDHGLLLSFANNSEISGNFVRGRLQPQERWLSSRGRGKAASEDGMLPAGDHAPSLAHGARIGPEKCVFIYNANKIDLSTTASRAAKSEYISPPGPKVTRWSATPSSATAIKSNTSARVTSTGRRMAAETFGATIPPSISTAMALPTRLTVRTTSSTRCCGRRPAKVLVNSPAVQIIRWAQARFPAMLPGGVVDTHPLMAPTPLPAQNYGEERGHDSHRRTRAH
jgi:nitrous oxidase accessory protein